MTPRGSAGDHPRPDCPARVLAVHPERLDLLLPDYGVELSLRLVERGGEPLAVDDGRHEVSWTAGGTAVTVRVFDAVRVAVRVDAPKSAEDDVGVVAIELVSPAPPDGVPAAPPAKRRRAG